MVAFISVSLLALWWLFCILSAISSHRARLSLSPKERGQPEERERIFEVRPPRRMHPMARLIRAVIVGVLGLSFVLIMLPFYMHAWFVGDPDKEHDHVA